MAFDLSSVLRDVSSLDTPEEQITRLPLDLLDPDPDNFYSLDGLDELAGNIETVGLLDPIRVRPAGDRYIVVSGHRRRAACMLIRDGGSQQFKDGVPCIIELGECSDALRRLRLIYANSSTRQLSAAELSRQAEEVTRILYELKEQGMEFSGRMRDHVAEACRLSKTKIGRLHAIRANLIPELLARFDAGDVNEDVAYELSRFPVEIQQMVAEHMAQPRVTRWPSGETLRAVFKDLDAYRAEQSCPAKAGAQCCNVNGKILRNMFSWSWEMCRPGHCCLDCAKAGRTCRGMCQAGRDRLKLDKAVQAEKEAKEHEEAAARKEVEQKVLRKEAARLLVLAEHAGLRDSDSIGPYGKGRVSELREVVAGKAETNKWQLQPYDLGEAKKWARKLKCTVGELLGEKPQTLKQDPASLAPTWQTGRPKRAGRYFVRVKHKNMSVMEQRMYFDPDLDDLNCWRLFGGPLGPKAEILGWWPIPDEEE